MPLQEPIQLRAEYHLSFLARHEMPMFTVLRPRIDHRQTLMLDEFQSTGNLAVVEYCDVHGNRCQRLTLPAGECELWGSVEALVTDGFNVNLQAGFVDIRKLPDKVVHYLLPSRYCESDRLGRLASYIVGDTLPGMAQVEKIASWIREEIAYRPGEGTELRTAEDTLQLKQGVCRDLAHLGIALCRAISIPARFVSGYLEGLQPMDFHAWFEVWLGGRWHGVDPSQLDGSGGRIRIAVGRDGADVPIYNQFGPALLHERMQFDVRRVGPADP